MPLLVVGSVGIDTVETPQGQAEEVLGGAAAYFAYAASFFCRVRLVSAIGGDFPVQFRRLLESRPIDTSGLEVHPDRPSFRWHGRYSRDMNQRQTVSVHLNVIDHYRPQLPEAFRACPYVFLANGAPDTQLSVLDQLDGPRAVVADTMDLWINGQRTDLMRLLGRIDGLVINDQEARLLAGTDNLVLAGRAVQRMGPSLVVVKKGEHGAMCFDRDRLSVLPAFPLADVIDPTGAGDSFAGGMMGRIASEGSLTAATVRRAVAYGCVTASFTVEGFSLDRLQAIERSDIERRLEEFRSLVSF